MSSILNFQTGSCMVWKFIYHNKSHLSELFLSTNNSNKVFFVWFAIFCFLQKSAGKGSLSRKNVCGTAALWGSDSKKAWLSWVCWRNERCSVNCDCPWSLAHVSNVTVDAPKKFILLLEIDCAKGCGLSCPMWQMPTHNLNAGSGCYMKLSIRLAKVWDENNIHAKWNAQIERIAINGLVGYFSEHHIAMEESEIPLEKMFIVIFAKSIWFLDVHESGMSLFR